MNTPNLVKCEQHNRIHFATAQCPQCVCAEIDRNTVGCAIKTSDAQLCVDVDPVNHPPHYKAHPSGIECIEITRHMTFNLGNAVKYIWRADHKHATVQDLKKAIWYIEDEIKRIENEH